MKTIPDPDSGHGAEGADDRQIRECLARNQPAAAPSGIEARVLQKVGRRRRMMRSVRAVAAVAVLASVGALTRGYFLPGPAANAVALSSAPLAYTAGELGSLSSETAAFVSVSESAPVASLGVVVDDQLALLQCLKSFMEQ